VNALIAFQMLWYWNSAGKKKVAAKPQPKGGKGKGGKGSSANANSPKKRESKEEAKIISFNF
jgi:hypothetical protein